MMICIEGIIIPADWDEKGKVVDLAIATADEKEYLITDKDQVARLKPLLRQKVEIRGILRTKAGRGIIKVKRFRKLKSQVEHTTNLPLKAASTTCTMEERKMKKNMKKILLGILIIGLTVFLSGIAPAESEVSVSGVINEDGQLVDDDGMTYDIAENDEGNEIMEMVGQKITVKGTVMEAEGTKIITVSSFKIIEE